MSPRRDRSRPALADSNEDGTPIIYAFDSLHLHVQQSTLALVAYGRMGAGVFVYDFCPDCSEPFAVRGTMPMAEAHQCAVS